MQWTRLLYRVVPGTKLRKDFLGKLEEEQAKSTPLSKKVFWQLHDALPALLTGAFDVS